MPDDGMFADFHHGLGLDFRFFGQARPQSARQYQNIHGLVNSLRRGVAVSPRSVSGLRAAAIGRQREFEAFWNCGASTRLAQVIANNGNQKSQDNQARQAALRRSRPGSPDLAEWPSIHDGHRLPEEAFSSRTFAASVMVVLQHFQPNA